MDFSKILKAFDTSTQISISVATFTLVLLMLHNKYPVVLETFGAFDLINSVLGPIFLICLAAWVIFFIGLFKIVGIKVIAPWIKNKGEIKDQKHLLSTLSKAEKEFLNRYFDNDTGTLYSEISDGVAGGLAAKKIIFRASNVAIQGSTSFPFNIQPWATVLLRGNPEYLR